MTDQQTQCSYFNTPVKVAQHNSTHTGYKRDLTFFPEHDGLSEEHYQRSARLGLIKGNSLHAELIWIIGTYRLQLYEHYPELIQESFFCFNILSELQYQLEKHNEPDHNNPHDDETAYKYLLADLIREALCSIDTNTSDPLIIYDTAGNALRECLHHIDEYTFGEVDKRSRPTSLSLVNLYNDGHLARLNNQTAPTAARLLAEEPVRFKKNTAQPKPKKHWGGYRYIKFSFILVTLIVFSNYLHPLLRGLGLFLNTYPILSMMALSAIGIACLSYIIQLTPKKDQSHLYFIIESAQTLLTLITCLWMLSNFFYPFNPINKLICRLLEVGYPIAASLNILLSMIGYTLLNALLQQVTEAKESNAFPSDTETDIQNFLLLIAPYRNKVWQLAETYGWKLMVIPIVMLGLFLIAHFGFFSPLISAFATVFNVSRTIALLTLVSVVYYGKSLSKTIKQTGSESISSPKKHSVLESTVMLAAFVSIMVYIFNLDYAILNNTLMIIGMVFQVQAWTVGATSLILLACACIAIVMLLPKNLHLKEAFKRNPIQQAEHIFIELNTFYYLYGLRHPLVMMLFLALFIVSYASFYHLLVPSYLASIAYNLAVALVSQSSGVSFLAFTASLMIGNFLILGYDLLALGKRSYIARLAKLCELYSLDVLISSTVTLVILNLFIVIPYIQSHLGTIAMIGSLSFLFKIAVISYDFQRDNEQKSFIAACLTFLLWPFYVIKALYHEPKVDTLLDLAYALEQSIIRCLLIFLYDIPFKIFLRIFEVMLYAVSNLVLVWGIIFKLDQFNLAFAKFKYETMRYLDFFRISVKKTLFKYENHYRLWHLLSIIFMVVVSIECITHGLGQTAIIIRLFTHFKLHPVSISYFLYANPILQSLFLIQTGVAIILLLSLALVNYIAYTHKRIELTTLKETLYTHTRHQIVCLFSLSLFASLIGIMNAAYILPIQISLIIMGILIQHQLTLPNIFEGITILISTAVNDLEISITTDPTSPLKLLHPIDNPAQSAVVETTVLSEEQSKTQSSDPQHR